MKVKTKLGENGCECEKHAQKSSVLMTDYEQSSRFPYTKNPVLCVLLQSPQNVCSHSRLSSDCGHVFNSLLSTSRSPTEWRSVAILPPSWRVSWKSSLGFRVRMREARVACNAWHSLTKITFEMKSVRGLSRTLSFLKKS